MGWLSDHRGLRFHRGADDHAAADAAGADIFAVACSGQLDGHSYEVQVTARFGPGDRGSLAFKHQAFRHLSSDVPAAAYTVEMVAVPWHFGGRRWFIVCPRSGRRVLKLYLPNGADRFASRAALGLAYRVQRLDPIQKGHARLARAFAKLGARYDSIFQSVPVRPKWMRSRTYDRLAAEIEAARAMHRDTYTERLRCVMEAEDRAFARVMAAQRRQGCDTAALYSRHASRLSKATDYG